MKSKRKGVQAICSQLGEETTKKKAPEIEEWDSILDVG